MIITSSKIITSPAKTGLIDRAAIVISKGTIQVIGPLEKIRSTYQRQPIIELGNTVLMPGLVNVHTHLELPALLDAIRTKTFPDWVLNLIHAKKDLKQKDYWTAAKRNIEELVQSGTTTIGEICTHDVSPAVLKQKGLRSTIFREIISMDPSAPVPRLSSAVTRPTPLTQNGLSPHSPYTVSQEVLQRISSLSEKKDLRVCMHIAESKDEIKLLQRKKSGLEKVYQFAEWDRSWAPTGSSSFEYLDRIGFLSPSLLAVHAVQTTNSDLLLIKKSGTAIAHCPRSNMELGVGRMPLKKFLDAGIPVGLGTDSLASSAGLNMWDEMRYALKIHKKDGITARDILDLATRGGAKALGLAGEIGSLEPGMKADIIAVPLPSKNTGDIYSDLLGETKSCIMTMVNGKILHLDADYDR